jgi:uncharacterized membrane protein (DUF485 family)
MDPRLEHDIDHHDSHQRRLAAAVMKRQLTLSLRIAAVFLVMLFGLPLVNYFAPGLANTTVFGITLTWLFMAILFYPITLVLCWMFIRSSNRIEHEIATSMRHEANVISQTSSRHSVEPAITPLDERQ